MNHTRVTNSETPVHINGMYKQSTDRIWVMFQIVNILTDIGLANFKQHIVGARRSWVDLMWGCGSRKPIGRCSCSTNLLQPTFDLSRLNFQTERHWVLWLLCLIGGCAPIKNGSILCQAVVFAMCIILLELRSIGSNLSTSPRTDPECLI